MYMDDCLVHSPTLEQHLLDVAEVLVIFRRRQLYAKSSKCEFGRQELGFHAAACLLAIAALFTRLLSMLLRSDLTVHAVRL